MSGTVFLDESMKNSTAIGYLVSHYPTVTHTFVLREIRALRRAGLDICVVSVRPSDRHVEDMSPAEVEEHSRTDYVLGMNYLRIAVVQALVFLKRPLRYIKTLWFAWTLSKGTPRMLLLNSAYFAEAVVAGHFFEKKGVVLVHTHFSSTVALFMSRLFGIRFSMTIHGPDEFNDVVGFHMARKVAEASFVSTISQFASSQVMRASDPKHWAKVHTIPLGVDPEKLVPQPAVPRAEGDGVRLLFVGRLAAAKAPHLLVRSIAELRKKGKNVSLTVVGDGPLRASLEKMISRLDLQAHVFLAGACNFDSVIGFYRNSDIFVLPSFAEGVPVVLMEAMALQVPCVSTWITGIPELIKDQVDGLLIPPASVDAMVEAVCRLIDDPDLAGRIGLAGREKVLSKYNLEHNSATLGDQLQATAGLSVS